ncbi:MAG: helix-turn-helix domain-containing protein [Candidatus Komeilibacteria bacterium]
MNTFTKKRIVSHQTVPETLRLCRQNKNISLEGIAKQLRIQPEYLQALEDGAYEKLPGEIYAKQWLRQYGQYLDLDIKWLCNQYQHERGMQMQFQGFTHEEIKSPRWWLSWLNYKTLKLTMIIIAALAFSVYLGAEVKDIMQPPTLTIYEPINNITTTDRTIRLAGQTEAEIEVTINNETILANENGYFDKEIFLSPGLNVLQIIASKKHGGQQHATISVFRETRQAEENGATISYTK